LIAALEDIILVVLLPLRARSRYFQVFTYNENIKGEKVTIIERKDDDSSRK
jgi:hypothetical protein